MAATAFLVDSNSTPLPNVGVAVDASTGIPTMVTHDHTGAQVQTAMGTVITAPSGSIAANTTLSNAMAGGRYDVTANCTITVPAVGATGGDGNAFLARCDVEFFVSAGVTVTFAPGSGAVTFNYASSASTNRAQSGTNNIVVTLVSRPTVNNAYFLSGVAS